jgi:NAD(P)-dependent dehydrogenase (short-subunit alcohol dehydrogenase family)
MNRLEGKRALITGGTTGIGLETARQFLKEGAQVAITGLNSGTLDDARKDLGHNVLVLSSNAGDVPMQQTLAKSVQEAFGGLDILVVNAGIGEFRPLEKWDESAFDRSFAINLKGPFFLIQALADLRQTGLDRAKHVDQCASRHAEFKRLCGHEGRSPVPDAYPFGRVGFARHPRQCGQPRPDFDTVPPQIGSN